METRVRKLQELEEMAAKLPACCSQAPPGSDRGNPAQDAGKCPQIVDMRSVNFRPTQGTEGKTNEQPQSVEPRVTTAAERAVQKVFKKAETKTALSDHDKAQQVLHQNRERLRAERLAREADALNANLRGEK